MVQAKFIVVLCFICVLYKTVSSLLLRVLLSALQIGPVHELACQHVIYLTHHKDADNLKQEGKRFFCSLKII